jgi:hypothetical protein
LKNVFCRNNIQIAGANCSIYGCGTSRKNTLVSVFFELQQKTTIYRRKFANRWRGLSQRTLDREIDASLRNQIAQQTLHVCEKTESKHVSYFRNTKTL